MNRSAAGTRLSTSQKKQSKTAPPVQDEAALTFASSPADIDSDAFLDQAIALLREVTLRQMKENRRKPSSAPSAAMRAKDSTTLAGLVRTLEKLDALGKSREKKGKKPKARNDAELKEGFVRRLDQLLAAGRERSGPKDSQPG